MSATVKPSASAVQSGTRETYAANCRTFEHAPSSAPVAAQVLRPVGLLQYAILGQFGSHPARDQTPARVRGKRLNEIGPYMRALDCRVVAPGFSTASGQMRAAKHQNHFAVSSVTRIFGSSNALNFASRGVRCGSSRKHFLDNL